MNTNLKTDTLALKKLVLDRQIENISQLSKKTGVCRNTLGAVLRGAKQPSSVVMSKLILGLSIPADKAGEIFFSKNLRNG